VHPGWIADVRELCPERESMTPEMVRVQEALNGKNGEDAQRIAAAGVEVLSMLLRKNRDYGSSAFREPVLAPGMTPRLAMQCRMSDKVARISTLMSGQQAEVDESIRDTMSDLAGYIILWLGADQ
jgi:hypothetical protein